MSIKVRLFLIISIIVFVPLTANGSPLAQEKHCHLSSDVVIANCVKQGKLGTRCASRLTSGKQECLTRNQPSLQQRLQDIPIPEKSPVILTPVSTQAKSRTD